jgi:uroporphyrinogen decarboxylase
LNSVKGILERIIGKPEPDFDRLLKILTKSGLPDHVPLYELFFNYEAMEAILDKKLPDTVSTVEFYYKAGYDYVPVSPGLNLEEGSLIDTSSRYPIQDQAGFESYKWPDINSIDYSGFESVIPILPDGMKIIGQIGGVLETVEKLMGYNRLCFALMDEPELVESVVTRVSGLYEAMYEGMASIDKVGAIVISDDMGFNTQTLISAGHLRNLILPKHKKLADISHKHGKPCILHSCGQLSAIMDDIIDYVGIDAKHSFQDQIMPVTEAYEKYSSRIAILGGFDMDRLCRSTEEEVRIHTRMLVEELGYNGGYATGSGNSIPGYVPVRNVLAMLETAWQYRKIR